MRNSSAPPRLGQEGRIGARRLACITDPGSDRARQRGASGDGSVGVESIGRPALRARTDPHRADAQHLAGRARQHDRRHRGAVDRQRPRRVLPVPLAVLGLPAGAGGVGAGLREVGRHVRPKTDHAVRDRAVPVRVDPLRLRLEHAGVDRLPRRPGTRRRRCATDERDDRRRHLHPRRTGQGPGLPGQRVGDLRRGRSDTGRPVRAVPDLALDLLREHPAVRAGRLDADPPVPRVGDPRQAPDRLPRQHQPHRWMHPADPRPARGWAGLGLDFRHQHRRARRRCGADRRVHRRAAPRFGTGAAAVGVHPPGAVGQRGHRAAGRARCCWA